MTGAEVASPSPFVLSTASVFSALQVVSSLFPFVVVVLSELFSALLFVASLSPSASVALYEVSSVLPSFEILFLSAFVEIVDFHRKAEYFVHFGLNASVGTDVETLDIADRKHCLSEMS